MIPDPIDLSTNAIVARRETDEHRKARILFIDDEQGVLDGLRRMLRSQRRVWDMRFANGPEQALAMLGECAADIVVSDLRMPGMSGAELLEEIKQRWPGTVRIILSGDAEKNAVLRTVGPAHQFLAKPCQTEELKQAIARVHALRGVLTNERIGALVSGLESVPSLPRLYQELHECLRAENVSLPRVGEIVSRDPAMTAKILKIVNSAFFGLRRTVASPIEAVNILGIETIHALVLSSQAFAALGPQDIHGVDADAVADHNLRVAVMSRAIINREGGGKELCDAAFVAGLLHDIGCLILGGSLKEQYGWLVASAKKHQVPLAKAEQKVFHCCHGQVGAFLLGLWGIADPVVEAVALHHAPSRLTGDDPLLVAALHVANNADAGRRGGPWYECLDTAFLQRHGYDGKVDDWLDCCHEVLSQGDDDE